MEEQFNKESKEGWRFAADAELWPPLEKGRRGRIPELTEQFR